MISSGSDSQAINLSSRAPRDAAKVMSSRDASWETAEPTPPGVEETAMAAAFDAARHGLALLTPQGVVRRANAACEALLGDDPKNLVGRSLISAPWRDSQPDLREQIESALAEAEAGRAARFHYRTRPTPERSQSFDVSITPIACGEDGSPALLLEAHETTYHTKVESALHSANAKLENILASTLDPVVTIDAHGTIRSASRSFERVFGYTPDELIGRNVKILIPEPHHSNHDGYLARYRQTGQTGILGRTRELEAVRRDGERFPIEISVSRVDIPSQPEPLFTGIIRDISERKRAEQERQLLQDLTWSISVAKNLNEAMFSALARLGDLTGWDYGEVWIPEPDGRRLAGAWSWRREGASLERFETSLSSTSFPPGEGLAGRVWERGEAIWATDLNALSDREFLRRDIADEEGIHSGVGVPIMVGEQPVAVVLFFLRRRAEEDPRLLRLVSTAVTPLGALIQRKRAEAQREESERRLRDMLERVELAGVMLDRDGRVARCNRFLLRLTGWEREEAIGRDWFETFLPDENRQQVRDLFNGAIARGEIPAHHENDIVSRAGHRRRIAWNNTILRDAQGAAVGVTALGVDVTDQRRTEEELTRHREKLESLIAERTRELEATHEQLRLADRLASIGTLAAGLGHDMNNVLFPIRCRLDAIEASRIPADIRDQFQAVRRSVAYLQQLSDGLHLLSMDPERSEDAAQSTDIHQWWEQVGVLLRKAARGGGRFEASLADDLPEIAVAPHRLTQAVLNLVTNAGDAIDEEGTVHFWAEPFSDRRFVRLGVSDDGQGMSEDVKRQALDPFFTTKKRGLGTGLGLSLVRGVAQSAGGSISIDSSPGEGTTIVLNLPVAAPDVDADQTEPQSITAAVTISDPRSATFVASFLRAAGVEVRFAEDGDSGESRLWIVEPTEQAAQRAERFLAERPGRQVVAFGPASRAWTALGAIVISQTDDFDHIRHGIEEAIAAAKGARS